MIVFTNTGGIALNKLRTAYNNDVLRFHSDAGDDPLYCDIELKRPSAPTVTILSLRMYPDPDGKFFINLKPYMSALINTRNFEDALEPDITSTDVQSLVYPYEDGTYLKMNLHITVRFAESSDGGAWGLQYLAGVEQLNDFNIFDREKLLVLSPFDKLTSNHYYLKYWKGYPFDIGLYSGEFATEFTVQNSTNGLDLEFTTSEKVSRIYLSDGRTDVNIENYLPLVDGKNKLTISSSVDEKYITIEKIIDKCGLYFKWLNKYGTYSYWLFENAYSIDRTAKPIGELDRDNTNLQDSLTRMIQIGQVSQDTYRAIAELLEEDERCIVEGIMDSPKVYMFTGQPFSRNSYKDWIEVTVKTANARIKNARQQLTNLVFDFELPQRYTQTL